ncbi:MAG: CpsD/CapB family tyrosine-protein kinase [Planctomycetota bacterium]
MGRIAQALKKAQQEREEQLRFGRLRSPSVATETANAAVSAAAVLDLESPCRQGASSPDSGERGVAENAIRGLGRGVWRRSSSPGIAPMPSWDVHPSVVAVHERSASIAEQYRATRTWLLQRNTTGEHISYAITSSLEREGKSVTTANLAVIMSEVRHLQVLAVDSDFHQGSLARLFKMSNTPGLADVLAGHATLEQAIARTPLANLSLLPAGKCHGLNPTELLNSSTASRVFDEIRERYQVVLVDTPPVQKLSDVGVVGALCTGVLMVVRMHSTPTNIVQQSVHWLQSNNLNVIGCLAAGCNLRDSRHMYRESYRGE